MTHILGETGRNKKIDEFWGKGRVGLGCAASTWNSGITETELPNGLAKGGLPNK